MTPEIESIRRSSRQFVREHHLLDGKYCIEDCSFSQCHFLTELESLGQATASELGDRLVLEKSTMSRLVNGLLEDKLVIANADPADGRQRLLSLTSKGRKCLERINCYSNAQVDTALDYITPAERQRVVEGLERYTKALRYARMGSQFTVRPTRKKDNPAVARIIRQVMTEYGAVGRGYSIEDAEVDAMFEAYPAPESSFFVIERQGKILGCGGMGPLTQGEPGICELRKMYFLPELRGTGMGTRLLSIILDSARATDYTCCYLETLQSMSQARHLYSRQGFEPIPQALGNTGHSACDQFMSLVL
jgi:putative acetyltransferase